MSLRTALSVVSIAALLALATSAVPGEVTVNYSDVKGCTAGCRVDAAGWPFPYLADHPGASPAGEVSLVDAFFGEDRVLATSLAASLGAWTALVAALAYFIRRPRGPHKKRRRH
jgi:hypothetical protein